MHVGTNATPSTIFNANSRHIDFLIKIKYMCFIRIICTIHLYWLMLTRLQYPSLWFVICIISWPPHYTSHAPSLLIRVFHKFAMPLINLILQLHSSTDYIRLVMMTHSTSILGLQHVMTAFVISTFSVLDLSVMVAIFVYCHIVHAWLLWDIFNEPWFSR